MTSFFQREMSNCTWKCHQCNNIACCSTEHWAGTEQKEELVPLKRVCLVRSCEQRETSVLWAEEELLGCWPELSLEELDCRLWDGCCNKTIALTSVPLLGAIYLFKPCAHSSLETTEIIFSLDEFLFLQKLLHYCQSRGSGLARNSHPSG